MTSCGKCGGNVSSVDSPLQDAVTKALKPQQAKPGTGERPCHMWLEGFLWPFQILKPQNLKKENWNNPSSSFCCSVALLEEPLEILEEPSVFKRADVLRKTWCPPASCRSDKILILFPNLLATPFPLVNADFILWVLWLQLLSHLFDSPKAE